ncbi:MAG: DegT/DnrJ/EryC1/StrS family aminotransferase [Candidatus Omnitrophica bacterium]|nr:DegT/DnrJ/EryC1/StrS family aminotransferase [Candidatus Omnitrophota bacterium]MCM8768153.1 DegT/DnrJ/EryC1/StrS family aminotransferase [Candidatus Omnitrophota bacterium]
MAERVYGEREIELLRQVLASRNLGALSGKFTPMFEEKFARLVGTRYAVAMNCAMSVLHASLMCAGVGAGSEVICDSLFIFGALAALYTNALPKFVDIHPVSHCLDPDKLEVAITERTKAVVVTHAWGLPAEMDRIVEIAHRYKLVVIEDCAHAILATYKGRYTGSWGDIGSFSFQASKQMSLGDGGMATTSNEQLANKLDLHSGAPTFHSVAHGLHYNYRLNELTSAVGIAQLEQLPDFIKGLQKVAGYYDQAIAGCSYLVPQQFPGSVSTYHLWAATFDGERYGLSLAGFKNFLEREKITEFVNLGYTGMPAYKHPVIKDKLAHAFHCQENQPGIDYCDGLCPVAERVIPRILLTSTVIPEEKAQENAERLYQALRKLEGK